MLTINTLREASGTANHVTINERLFLNAAQDALVPPGHPDAAFLFCTPGKRVLKSELERLGVKIAGGKKGKKDAENKADKGAENKGATAGVEGNVKTAKRTIAGVEDVDELDGLAELEGDREGGPRKSVAEAIDKRRAALES